MRHYFGYTNSPYNQALLYSNSATMFAEIGRDNGSSLTIRIFGVEDFISFVDESESGFGLVLLQGLDAEDVVFSIRKNGKFDVSACLTAEPPFSSWPKYDKWEVKKGKHYCKICSYYCLVFGLVLSLSIVVSLCLSIIMHGKTVKEIWYWCLP